MVGLQTLDLAIGVRVPASQPKDSLDRAVVNQSITHPKIHLKLWLFYAYL